MHRYVSGLLFTAFLLIAPTLAAQATRTWVSGVGDDANPCSRTAPCKTFAGAISKTAAGGEISVLDPGGFGAVNITKSITINGEGTLGSVLFAGTNGIIVNGAGIVVNLVNLSINGGTSSSPGLNGVRVIQAREVSLDRCDIFNFSKAGVADERTTAGNLTIRNSRIHGAIGAGPMTAGVSVYPGASAVANRLLIEDTQIFDLPQASSMGVVVANGATAQIVRSSISDTWRGLLVYATSGVADATVKDSTLFNNETAVRVTAGGTARLDATAVTGSTTNALEIVGGTVESFGNNVFAANTGNNGAGTVPVNLK